MRGVQLAMPADGTTFCEETCSHSTSAGSAFELHSAKRAAVGWGVGICGPGNNYKR